MTSTAVFRPPARIPPRRLRNLEWREPPFQPGYPNAAVQGVIYAGSGYSLQTGAVPPVSVGDTFVASNTSPGGYQVQVQPDGTVIILTGGDTRRQSFTARLYRRSTGQFDAGFVTVWINEVAPTWASSITLGPYAYAGYPIASINLATPAYATSPEGDTLTFAVTSGSLPPGIFLTSAGVLYGTPTTPGVYPLVITAYDITGTGTACPASTLSVTTAPPVQAGDNIRIARHARRLRGTRDTWKAARDWQTQTRLEAEKTRRIAAKRRRQWEEEAAGGRAQNTEPEHPLQAPLSSAVPPPPGPIDPHLAYSLRMAQLRAQDDQAVHDHLAREHAHFLHLVELAKRYLQ